MVNATLCSVTLSASHPYFTAVKPTMRAQSPPNFTKKKIEPNVESVNFSLTAKFNAVSENLSFFTALSMC